MPGFIQQVRQVTCLKAARAELESALSSAAAAADTLILQRSSSGTGEILRTNFGVMLDVVLGQDGHLLTQRDAVMLQTYRVRPHPSRNLWNV